MSELIYRIQDKTGRGPYKPGTSQRWVDPDRDASRPPFFVEFGIDIVSKVATWECCGCGFRTMEQLNNWFSGEEKLRLQHLGYNIVAVDANRILAESPTQLVFTRTKPLKDCVEIIPWGSP